MYITYLAIIYIMLLVLPTTSACTCRFSFFGILLSIGFSLLRPFMDCLGVLTGISFVDSFDD